jgi:TPR repeat protein
MSQRGALLCLAVLLAGCAAMPDVGTVSEPGDPQAGVLVLGTGRSVSIRPEQLTYTGKARFDWPDGRRYDGMFVDGQPDGIGSELLPDGTRYRGHWYRGQRHGVGTLELPDGGRYEGDFSRGERAGLGIYVGAADSYDGEWLADAPHGIGTFNYPDGSRYQGEWIDGRRSGWGAYERGGSGYEGEWYNDVPHGFGTASEQTGYEYDGSWQAGERHGYGKTATRAGTAYEGTWVGDARHGFGRDIKPSGADYLGEWRNDSRWGQGRSREPNGSFHEGYWENDRPLGPGTRKTPQNVQITGTWNGDFVSSGIVTLPNGQDYAGNLYDRGNQAVNKRFLNWLNEVAAAGDPYAQLLMAEAYQRFRQPAPDDAKASQWYARAAASGLSEAQYRVALLYLTLQADDRTARALEWLLRAANQQHPDANALLGSYYQSGTYVPKNHKRAATHYEVAMNGGNEMARNNLAWLLATSLRQTLRDGDRAVELSEPIAVLSDDWGYLDTLAAALAERGDFAAAVRTQQRALALATGDADVISLQQMQQRLALFQQNQPYRE